MEWDKKIKDAKGDQSDMKEGEEVTTRYIGEIDMRETDNFCYKCCNELKHLSSTINKSLETRKAYEKHPN